MQHIRKKPSLQIGQNKALSQRSARRGHMCSAWVTSFRITVMLYPGCTHVSEQNEEGNPLMEHNIGSWLRSCCGNMAPQNTFIGCWKHLAGAMKRALLPWKTPLLQLPAVMQVPFPDRDVSSHCECSSAAVLDVQRRHVRRKSSIGPRLVNKNSRHPVWFLPRRAMPVDMQVSKSVLLA